MELFQTILYLRRSLAWCDDGLANQANGCARAIDALEEQLRLTNAPPPIGRRFSGHLLGCGGERCLRGISKGDCEHRDRIVGLRSMLMACSSRYRRTQLSGERAGAFLERAAEVDVRQAGVGGGSGKMASFQSDDRLAEQLLLTRAASPIARGFAG
jgi:hypothetical protein